MPYDGYIALWRKSLDSSVFQNEGLWRLWCLCLMKASYKKTWVQLDGMIEPIELSPGQFITGRFSLHKDFYGKRKKSKSPLTLWRWLQLLEKMKNLNIKTNNKYSIVTIVNWGSYQTNKIINEQANEQQVNNKRTTDEQQMNTNNKVNKVNNVNKKKINKRKTFLPDNYKLEKKHIEYANSKGITENIEDIFEGFCINHRKRGTQYVSWYATWQTWVRNEIKWDEEKKKASTQNQTIQEILKNQPSLEDMIS